MSTNKVSWKYLAGLFDGEGSVHLRKTSGRKYPQRSFSITIDVASSVHKKPMLLVKKFVNSNSMGTCNGKGNKRILWRVRLFSKKAKLFLENVYPYLIIKKPQAKLALDFLKNKPKRGEVKKFNAKQWRYEENVKKKMTELNFRGIINRRYDYKWKK